MAFYETVRAALQMMRNQKLKTAFSLVGVFVGVTFLIAVVSIIHGMNRYMVERFANTIVGANTFELRQHPDFQMGEMSAETWRAWRRRPRIADADADYLRAHLGTPTTLAKQCSGWMTLAYGARTANVELVGA
jgi:putative ABC transport system permease protein